MEKAFFTWVNSQLEERGWNYSELARRSNLSQSAVSLVMSGQRSVTCEFCFAIAKAFGERPEAVLRIAGLLPPSGGRPDDLTEDEAKWLEAYRNLSQLGKMYALEMIVGLVEAEKRSEEDG